MRNRLRRVRKFRGQRSRNTLVHRDLIVQSMAQHRIPERGPGVSSRSCAATVENSTLSTVIRRWCREFGGLKTEQVKRLKDFELENSRLHKAASDLTVDQADSAGGRPRGTSKPGASPCLHRAGASAAAFLPASRLCGARAAADIIELARQYAANRWRCGLFPPSTHEDGNEAPSRMIRPHDARAHARTGPETHRELLKCRCVASIGRGAAHAPAKASHAVWRSSYSGSAVASFTADSRQVHGPRLAARG
jgi:hypothetical protein